MGRARPDFQIQVDIDLREFRRTFSCSLITFPRQFLAADTELLVRCCPCGIQILSGFVIPILVVGLSCKTSQKGLWRSQIREQKGQAQNIAANSLRFNVGDWESVQNVEVSPFPGRIRHFRKKSDRS